MASHFASMKLHYTREETAWKVPLSYIFVIMFEEIYQKSEGKMITLTDREMIDEGEIDRRLNQMKLDRARR